MQTASPELVLGCLYSAAKQRSFNVTSIGLGFGGLDPRSTLVLVGVGCVCHFMEFTPTARWFCSRALHFRYHLTAVATVNPLWRWLLLRGLQALAKCHNFMSSMLKKYNFERLR